jgi:hypothetical protein
MEVGLSQIRQLLFKRLEAQGVEKCLVPGLLRLISNALSVEGHLTRQIVSKRLKFLGWEDFELDEHTYQLAMACFEDETATSAKSSDTEGDCLNYAFSSCR